MNTDTGNENEASLISSLPALSPAWIEALERAALMEKSLRMAYERHYRDKMDYHEFRMRRDLQLAVNRGEMDPGYARQLIEQWKATKLQSEKPDNEKTDNE